MPHRINITLTDEVYTNLKGYAEFIGKPPATVAGSLINEMNPTMASVTRAMTRAKKNNTNGIEELRQIVLQEISQVAQLAAGENQGQLFDDNKEQEK